MSGSTFVTVAIPPPLASPNRLEEMAIERFVVATSGLNMALVKHLAAKIQMG
jgi:hypothetical protein